MKTRNSFVFWFFGLLMLMLMIDLFTVLAQTNAVPPAPGEPATVVFPTGALLWAALIPPATFTITWALGKIPPLPKQILPWLTPLVGIGLGFVMDWAGKAELPIGLAGALGAVAVAMYEGIKDVVVRQGEDPADSMLTPTEKPEVNVPPVSGQR